MTQLGQKQLRQEFIREVKSRLLGPMNPEEELTERPDKRYLTGMVFPKGASATAAVADEEELPEDASADPSEEGLDSPTDLLFQRLPASVGLTFALSTAEHSVSVEISAARYVRGRPEIIAEEGHSKRKTNQRGTVWTRKHLPENASTSHVTFEIAGEGRQKESLFDGHASLHLFVRRSNGIRMATLSLINERETPEDSPVEPSDILFQVSMECFPSLGVPAYPEPSLISEDLEAEELALQYRSTPTFAVGHGCGVYWPEPLIGSVKSVAIDFIPTVEVPPVTTDIVSLPKAVQDCLSIVRLQSPKYDPLNGFTQLVEAYEQWRDRLSSEVISPRFEDTRLRVLTRIDLTVRRMRDGISVLRTRPEALEIFRKANRAMLLSIARTNANRTRSQGASYEDVDLATLPPGSIQWRPFQVAFFLLSLRGLWTPEHADRRLVDLIWFPTGGGKTEAYLAVAAFEIIRRRLIEGDAGLGTAVIKRYTLRLLTIQQFERAGSLICALETMRRKGEIDSATPFSLGLWVGADSAPNEHGGKGGAIAELHRIRDTIGKVDRVRVPLKKCPVCATPIVKSPKLEGYDGIGLREESGRVQVFCPNKGCSFHQALPISYIDDDLYRVPPTLLIGTIDKFAMLAWRDEARSFFGVGSNAQPPSLIIQDELHLISGPLGTMAGIYEAAVDVVISTQGRPAKYICATATIRRADDQIRKLYGRDLAVFPPPGLDAADSFFSRSRSDLPGRLYLGAMGQGHTPTFSNVIASTALLASAEVVRAQFGDIADTWWTLVAYHNSKRELGKTLSLARDDIPARLKALGEARTVSGNRVKELSANLRDSEIPEALYLLEMGLPSASALDFVACTNMLSVGVDVQRLGLMMVNGQPKTVSEYIQASSRVGRDSKRPPGIVFTLFSPTKPRDRSHYEFFRAFHKGYYRHVEPTSVTPYARPAIERGLHGAFLCVVRMCSSIHQNNQAADVLKKQSEIRQLETLLMERIESAHDGDISDAEHCLQLFIQTWMDRATEKGANLRFQSGGKAHAQLIRPYRQPGEGRETLQSLRHVDTPLRLKVPIVQVGGAETGT
jgi:hypothetical protein